MYVTPNGDIVCKVVLFGPPGSGRKTFIQALHDHFMPAQTTDMEALDLEGDHAQGFIWRSGQQLQVQGRSLAVTFMTLTGRSRFSQARRALVEAADGVVFVADARRQHLDENIDAMNDFMDQLRAHQLPEQLPMVIAYNHQDDSAALPTRQLDPLLNHFSAATIETTATAGRGVEAAWMALSGILLAEAEQVLPSLKQGPEPSLQSADEPGWLLCCHACEAMLEVESAAVGEVFTCGSCGASIAVIDPETGRTGPAHQGQPASHSGDSPAVASQGYGLQSLPAPVGGHEALSPQQSSTGPISAAQPFELAGFDLLKELDGSALGQRFRLLESSKGRKVRVFRVEPAVVATSNYRVQVEPYVRMAAKVSHPNILPIIALRWHNSLPYLISEDAPNTETLRQVLSRRRTLSPIQAMEIIQQLALALEEAARHGVVHGFLNPEWILVAGDGHVLIDGLGVPKAHAHLIQTLDGQSPSTEYYLAPEHLMVDAPSDIRSDMFLLGAILYRMLSAEGLITGYNAVEALHRFTATGMGALSKSTEALPRDLVNLLTRLTAIERRERFQHYGEAIEQIERVLGVLQRPAPGRGQTGTQRGQTAGRRRSGNVARGGGTGALPTGTGRTRTTTGPIRAPTGAQRRMPGTGRTTGAYGRGEAGSVTATSRRRGKKSNPALLMLVVILVVALLAGVGYVIYQQNQTTRARLAANDPPSTNETPARSQAMTPAKASQAVDAFAAEPDNEQRYRAAREAVAQLTGPQRTTLEHRIREIDDARQPAPIADPVTPPDTSNPDQVEEPTQPEVAADPADEEPATGEAEQLSARMQQTVADLRRAQRYGQALSTVRSNLRPGATLDFYLEEIQAEYAAMREATRSRVASASSMEELRRLLIPAREYWQMGEGDRQWAEETIAQAEAAGELPDHEPQLANATPGDQQDPATPDAGGDEAEPEQAPAEESAVALLTIPDQSPAGYSPDELAVDGRVSSIITSPPVDMGAITRELNKLDANNPRREVISLRADLYFRRDQAVTNAITEYNARLRVTNPVAGGLWDVVSSDQQGLVISSPTGSSMALRWADIKDDEMGRLFQQLSRVKDIPAESVASAAVISLNHGLRTQASLLARQAVQAEYQHAQRLQQLMRLDRDRLIMDTIARGLQVSKQKDPFLLAEVVETLTSLPGAREPLVDQAISAFEERREAILAGTAGTGAQARDQLTFTDGEHRLAFPERRNWIISVEKGTYSSTGDAATLQRNDMGNAESVVIRYRLENADGRFLFNFRGVEVIGDPGNRKVTLRAQGSNNPVEMEMPWATQTDYQLSMTFDPVRLQMRVGLNRLDPVMVRLPRASADLAVGTQDGSVVALTEIDIRRLGQERPESPEALAERQESLRGLGLHPLGQTIKDPESPAIVIPEGPSPSGLGIPFAEGDAGVRLRVNGNGQMQLALVRGEASLNTPRSVVPVAEIGATPTLVTVRLGEGMAELKVDYGDGDVLITDLPIPDGDQALQLIVVGEKMLTIPSTPETLER